MGVVYQAWQVKLRRLVALKMVLAGPLAGEEEKNRFLVEIEAAARLHHPHIVQIHEVGELAGRPFFAMEYAEGGNLARRLAGTPLPAKQAAQLVELLARAMDYAHSRGIVHRDLTPGNILLAPAPTSKSNVYAREADLTTAPERPWTLDLGLWTPKITDFGLAKIVVGGGATQTKTGAVLGTPSYMSPEQATGRNSEIGPATDIYALGAILYEFLTGRPPFKAATSLDTVMQVVVEEPAAPTRLQPGIPRDIETICLKCLQKEQRKRYGTALDLAEDLERFQKGQPILARRISSAERLVRWGRRNPTIAALTAAVGLLLIVTAIGSSVAALWLRRERDDAVLAREDAVAAGRAMKEKLWQSLRDEARAAVLSRRRGQRFESLRAIREAAAVGRELALPSTDFDELRTLAVSALALPDVRPLREWEGIPPNTRGTACDAKLDRYARCDGEGNISVRQIADDREIAHMTAFRGENFLSMSPDGQFVAARYGDSCRAWRVDRNAPSVPIEEGHVLSVGFSSDNRLLVVRSDGSIRVRDLNGSGAPREIVKVPGASTGTAVAPSGDRFALSTGRGVEIRDLATGALLPLVAAKESVERGNTIAWHPSGDVIAFADRDLQVRVWDVRADRALAVLGGFTNAGIIPAFTAGGDLLVTSGWEGMLRFWDWRAGRQVLSTPGSFVVPPCYCERLLVYHTSTSAAVWQVDAAAEYRTLTVAPASKQHIDFWEAAIHPRGRVLSVAASVGVVLWDLDRGIELATMPEKCWNLATEPSGALVTNCRGILYRRPMTFEPEPAPRLRLGPAEKLSLRGPYYAGLDLSGDGRTLGLAVLAGASVQGSQGRVRHLPHWDCRSVAVSPDGRWVVSGSFSGSAARIWRADTGELVKELLPGVGIGHVRFSLAGTWLATAGAGLQLWRAGTWEEGPRIGISNVFAFSPDESLLAVEDGTGSIRLLNPATGREIARLTDPNQDPANFLLFTPDGRRLVAVSKVGRAVHVWDLAQLRDGLGELGLDWDAPSYPPAPSVTALAPIVVDAEGLRQPLPSELPPKDAIATYTLAIALSAYNPEAHFRRGIARAQLRDWRGALDDLATAIRLNPGQVRYHQIRSQVCQRLEKYDLLLDDLERLLVLEPGDSNVLNSLAWILATGPQRLRDPAKALAHAQAAVRLEPTNTLYVNTLGVTLYRLGRYSEAREILEKNADKQVKEFAAFDLFFLAMCNHSLGDGKKAQSEYERAVRSFQEHQAELSDPIGKKDLSAFRAEAEAVLNQPRPHSPLNQR
jgi:eukaryotic-like serine/threonine-protein kinase